MKGAVTQTLRVCTLRLATAGVRGGNLPVRGQAPEPIGWTIGDGRRRVPDGEPNPG